MELNINDYQEYYTYSNGSRSYKIIIYHNNLVRIFKSDNCILNVFPQQIFIGKSDKNKMFEYSGAYNKHLSKLDSQDKATDELYGNTILLKMNDTNYIYIGCKIFSFTTEYLIISYHSPIGNNDIPYPYAIDSEKNYYLLIEGVMLKNSKELETFVINNNDPYEYYYKASLITEDRGLGRKPLFQNNFNIMRFYIGKEIYTMNFSISPSNEFDHFTKELGNNVYVRDKYKLKRNIKKHQYIEIIEDFGNTIGASSINNIIYL
jgi:hypothetical protein